MLSVINLKNECSVLECKDVQPSQRNHHTGKSEPFPYFGFVGFPETFRLFHENFHTMEVYKSKTACYSSVSNFPVVFFASLFLDDKFCVHYTQNILMNVHKIRPWNPNKDYVV